MPDITPYVDADQLAALRPLLSFWVEGSPVPKARPRVVNGETYTPKRTKTWEWFVAQHAQIAMMDVDADILSDPLSVTLHFFYGGGRADLDNLVKAVLDALNRVVWEDDVQVEALRARVYRKIPKARQGVRVTIDLLIDKD